MRGNVRHIRSHSARPFDWQRDEDAVWVQLTPLEWSVLVAGAERSEVTAAREVAALVSEQVVAVQLARLGADVADANADARQGAS
jgi:hypothetical protein